jgi:CshA-type fibril repeat protein
MWWVRRHQRSPLSVRPPRARRAIAPAAGLLTALLLVAAASVAPAAIAAPLAPADPTVFMSQLLPGAGGTTLRVLTQDRSGGDGSSGGVTVSDVGSPAPYDYNALGYRVADGYLYGIVRSGAHRDELVQIGSGGELRTLGPVSGLPTTSGSRAYLSGAFGEGAYADTLFVKDNRNDGPLYPIDVVSRTVTAPVPVSRGVSLFDFAWAGGYLWGGESDGAVKSLIRLDVRTGTVTRFPAGQVFRAEETGDYGAAWRYGNGNLGFLNNQSGMITQVQVTDPASAAPTITAVSRVQGTPGNGNDGASTVAAQTADLVVTVTEPAPVRPASPVGWTVTVRNDGPGPSSGSTFRFPVPAGVTALTVPTGCGVAGGTVTCVVGELADRASDDYLFSATSPPTGAVAVSVPITVLGNEEDPTAGTAVLVVVPDQVLTSDGVGTDRQSVATGAPAGAVVTLLDGGTPVGSLTGPGGRYAVDGSALTFTPVYGWSGTAPTARFQVTAGSGATGSGGYTATVAAPAPPGPPALTSSGTGTVTQQVALPVPPAGGSVAVLDADGEPVTSLTVPGQGRYGADLGAGTISFTPVLGFAGTGRVVYRLTDAYGQSGTSTYQPTVAAPAPPTARALTSTGAGTAPQRVTLPAAPAGGSRTLLGDDGAPATDVDRPGQGAYVWDASSGVVTFTPVLGFEGTADPVRYRLTDAYGQSVSNTATPTVGRPAGPSSPPLLTSSGVGTATQQVTVPDPPAGGSRSLLDERGAPATEVTVAGEGRYALDPVTETITFTPVLGHAGAGSVGYRLTDVYGTAADALYRTTVFRPDPPAPTAATTTGIGTVTQQTLLPAVPDGGAGTLVDGDGVPVPEVTVAGKGRYTVDAATGTASFEPVLGFQGPATPVHYRLTDAYGQSETATWTPTVLPPAPPVAEPRDSHGVGTATQSVTLPGVPEDGERTLLGPEGATGDAVTSSWHGPVVLDPVTGLVTFTPVLGFVGTAAIGYRLTDAYGQTSEGVWSATVAPPAPPVAGLLQSTGVGTVQQQVLLPAAPDGGSRNLLDGQGVPVTEVTVAGEGSYTLDPVTGTVTFTPVLGRAGAGSVGYRLTDAYQQAVDASYRTTVAPPDPPAPTEVRTTGTGTGTQRTLLAAVPVGGSRALLDGDGDPVSSLTVPGQGTYRWDAATGTASFEPVLGFQGPATPVRYRLTDAYGQSGAATWTPTVLPPAPPVAGSRESSGVGTAGQSVRLPEVPDAGDRTLVDPDGAAVVTVTLPGRGQAVLDPATGLATFTPVAGLVGTTAIGYRLTDAYGQVSEGVWSASVTAPGDVAPPTAPGAAPPQETVTPPAAPAPPGTTVAVTPPSPSPSPPPSPSPSASLSGPSPVPLVVGPRTLAYTGEDVGPWATLGLVLLGAGAVLLVLGRRSRV